MGFDMADQLAFIHIDEMPGDGCLVQCEGKTERLVELFLSGMMYDHNLAIMMLAACKFYSDRNGKDLFQIMKDIKL